MHCQIIKLRAPFALDSSFATNPCVIHPTINAWPLVMTLNNGTHEHTFYKNKIWKQLIIASPKCLQQGPPFHIYFKSSSLLYITHLSGLGGLMVICNLQECKYIPFYWQLVFKHNLLENKTCKHYQQIGGKMSNQVQKSFHYYYFFVATKIIIIVTYRNLLRTFLKKTITTNFLLDKSIDIPLLDDIYIYIY